MPRHATAQVDHGADIVEDRRLWGLVETLSVALVPIAPPFADTAPPKLVMDGAALLTYMVGDTWLDPGARCFDGHWNGADVVGATGAVVQELQVHVEGAPPDGTLQAPGDYTIRYTCLDAAGNKATEKKRTLQIVLAARYWRVKTSGTVGSGIVFWQVAELQFFSDVTCTKGIRVQAQTAGTRQTNGMSFSTPLGRSSRADTAFAAWDRQGRVLGPSGLTWSAGRACSNATDCYVGFAFDEPVLVNCVKLTQGGVGGSYADSLHLQWRRTGFDDGPGSSGYSDWASQKNLGPGLATVSRLCGPGCNCWPGAGLQSQSCSSYVPTMTVSTHLSP